jgi:hypothetical protein
MRIEIFGKGYKKVHNIFDKFKIACIFASLLTKSNHLIKIGILVQLVQSIPTCMSGGSLTKG